MKNSIKFTKGEVVFCGKRDEATSLMKKMKPESLVICLTETSNQEKQHQTAGYNSTQTAGYNSTQTAGYNSTQTAGDYSTLISWGSNSKKKAGIHSQLIWNIYGENPVIAIVGKDGIKENVFYKLNDKFNVVKV